MSAGDWGFSGWTHHEVDLESGECERRCGQPPPHVARDWRPDPSTGELKPPGSKPYAQSSFVDERETEDSG